MFVKKSLVQTVLIPALLVLAPGLLVAQEATVPQGAPAPQGQQMQLPPEAQAMVAELQQIQARLQPVHQQAMQDTEVQAMQASLSEDIQAAMVEADPETPERVERLEALMERGQAARASQDEAAMTEIVTEARAIEQRLQATQAAVLESPAIASRVEAFEATLLETMEEIDPEVGTLLERARALDAELAATLGQGG
jgi:ferritin-like metal-binding protein YciE